MHELALTQGIIDIVCSEQEKQGFKDVREIRLKVGEYSGIVPDYIKDFFPAVSKGTCAEKAALVRVEFYSKGCGIYIRSSGRG